MAGVGIVLYIVLLKKRGTLVWSFADLKNLAH